MIANATGTGSRSDLLQCAEVGWQTLKYLSIVMLTVIKTEPTLPMWASPILKIKYVELD